MADALFDFIADVAGSKESLSLLDSVLNVFRDEVVVALFWKRLLKTAAQFPKVFAPRLFELVHCGTDTDAYIPETFYELGLFLKAAASEFTQTNFVRLKRVSWCIL